MKLIYQCKYCDVKTTLSKDMRIHLLFSHKISKPKIYGWWKCEYCDYMTTNKDRIEEHELGCSSNPINSMENKIVINWKRVLEILRTDTGSNLFFNVKDEEDLHNRLGKDCSISWGIKKEFLLEEEIKKLGEKDLYFITVQLKAKPRIYMLG